MASFFEKWSEVIRRIPLRRKPRVCATCNGEGFIHMRWSDGVLYRDHKGRGYIDRCPDCNS
jgi:DnaJ-class molecular chaperone